MSKKKDKGKQLNLPISQIEKLENEATTVSSYRQEAEGENPFELIKRIDNGSYVRKHYTSKKK